LSDEADHDNDTDDTVAPVLWNDDGAVGGVVSGQAAVETVANVFAERFPAASNASTENE
jgi:hypothetical protein